MKCVHIIVTSEVVSEDLTGVYWMPAPLGAAGIGVDGFGGVVMDLPEYSIMDGVDGGLDIYDGPWLGRVFVLKEKG